MEDVIHGHYFRIFGYFEEMKGDLASFIDYKAKLEDSKEAFDMFNKHKVKKIVFDLTS